MRLLLDTHALIWYFQGNLSISQKARDAIEDDDNQKYMSHATLWEMSIKLGLGRLRLPNGIEGFFERIWAVHGFSLLASEFSHYIALLSLPHHHRDPFDRLLIAQAKHEGMTPVSCDPQFAAYNVPILW